MFETVTIHYAETDYRARTAVCPHFDCSHVDDFEPDNWGKTTTVQCSKCREIFKIEGMILDPIKNYSIDEIMRLSNNAGRYFFDDNTIKGFKGIIYPQTRPIEEGILFTHSIKQGTGHPRIYKLALILWSGDTMNQASFDYHRQALKAMKEYSNE